MRLAHSFRLLAMLGAAHAVSDGSAGWLIGHLSGRLSIVEVGGLVLLYKKRKSAKAMELVATEEFC